MTVNVFHLLSASIALDAGLGETAKHYLEDSFWAKAILTYIDKLSETPDRGA
ncbi:hypothetical protein [Altericista sp. CCNU0014]|uniref:hypothetical protein n=1 Tax=Altericista sp. CCNU0014 TaxID=3082949 RepID=UPI00384A4E10